MKASATLLAFVLALLLSGCVTKPPLGPTEELDIREVVLRSMLRPYKAGDEAVYFSIRANGKEADPDDAFMRRFSGNQPQPKVSSQCRATLTGVVDKTTGAPGTILSATAPIRRLSATDVETFGGWYRNGRNAGSYLYRLVKVNGKWKVVRGVLATIS